MDDSISVTSPTASAQDLQFLGLLCRHLVGVCWVTREVGFDGKERGEPSAICATAAAVEFNDRLYLVTAGHIIKLIERTATDSARRITKATLFNAWAAPGQTTQPPLPIDLARMNPYAKYDRGEGIDFAMILLGDEHARTLRERGTMPFREQQIGVPAGRTVEQCWLLGNPEELQVPFPVEAGCGLEIEPNVFRVFERDKPEYFFETDQLRIYATVPPEVPLKDLNGMSGGPLFAFTRGARGYDGWIAGLQSGWNADERVIAASPASVYLDQLRKGEEHIRRAVT